MLDGNNPPVGAPSQAQLQPSADDVRAQLERLLASPDLDLPGRARKFLRYIVEETLAGRADRICRELGVVSGRPGSQFRPRRCS